MRNFRILAFIAVAVVSTGCLRVTHTLNLKPDGSGSISQTIAMSQAAMQQMGAMMAAQGSGSMMPSEEKLRSDAKSLGAGVRFVSSTPYKTGGYEGITALYAFDDVTKLNFNLEKSIAGAIDSPMTGDPNDPPDPDADIKLSFTREGGQPVLVITMPEVPKAEDITPEQKKQAEDAAKQVESNPAAEAMMKQMFQGMVMEVAINIEGTITQTNAPFVEGSRIILMRLDGDELMKSTAGLSQMMQMGDNPNFEEMIKKVPGLKVVTQREVRIAFK